MSKLRSINTSIWTDVWFENLPVSQKLLFIYLITNEKTNMLGVYEISKKKISFETGIDIIEIAEAFKYFEFSGKIKYKCDRVILLKYLKHQNYNFNMKKSAIDCYNELPEDLKIKGKHTLSRDLKGFETLCNRFLRVRKVEDEYEYEDEYKEEIEYKEELDLEIYYPVEKLKEFYLKNDNLIKAITENKDNKLKDKAQLKIRLEEFNTYCLETGNNSRLWNDYTSHFRNWNKKQKEKQKRDDRLPTQNIVF